MILSLHLLTVAKPIFKSFSLKAAFVTVSFTDSYIWHCKRASFTLQKVPFYTAKGHLLPCKRAPFTRQKGIFYHAKGRLLQCNIRPLTIQSAIFLYMTVLSSPFRSSYKVKPHLTYCVRWGRQLKSIISNLFFLITCLCVYSATGRTAKPYVRTLRYSG